MKYRSSKIKVSFLENFLRIMVSIGIMVFLPLQLMSAPVIILTTNQPILLGTQNTVGAMALWENAGTIDGVSINLRATITAFDGDTLEFSTALDDSTIRC